MLLLFWLPRRWLLVLLFLRRTPRLRRRRRSVLGLRRLAPRRSLGPLSRLIPIGLRPIVRLRSRCTVGVRSIRTTARLDCRRTVWLRPGARLNCRRMLRFRLTILHSPVRASAAILDALPAYWPLAEPRPDWLAGYKTSLPVWPGRLPGRSMLQAWELRRPAVCHGSVKPAAPDLYEPPAHVEFERRPPGYASHVPPPLLQASDARRRATRSMSSGRKPTREMNRRLSTWGPLTRLWDNMRKQSPKP
jgi:hypothetical protein